MPARRLIGAGIALLGLAYLLLPGASAPPLWGGGLMIAAGVGWGIYSLVGRTEADALAGTAANFLLLHNQGSAEIQVISGANFSVSPGECVALSGAVTSALGYALWYALLPALGATRAAVAQLSVPVIAIAAGAVLLGEDLTVRVILASALVLGGIAISLLRRSPVPLKR